MTRFEKLIKMLSTQKPVAAIKASNFLCSGNGYISSGTHLERNRALLTYNQKFKQLIGDSELNDSMKSILVNIKKDISDKVLIFTIVTSEGAEVIFLSHDMNPYLGSVYSENLDIEKVHKLNYEYKIRGLEKSYFSFKNGIVEDGWW